MLPELCVIIACFNAEATLSEQLLALARQLTDVTFEVLVCDNGSTDHSRDIVAALAYLALVPGLRLVDASAVRGPSAARNAGARATQAPLLAFVDADDVVADDWVQTMTQALRRHEFVAGRLDAHKLNSRWRVRSRALPQAEGLQTSPQGMDHAAGGNLGIRREVFERVNGFDETLTCLEDTDLCWRVQLTGAQLVFRPEVVVHARLRSTVREMWRQAVGYGRAFAELEVRYPSPRTESIPDERQRWAVLLRNLPGVPWLLGWHWGYRSKVAPRVIKG